MTLKEIQIAGLKRFAVSFGLVLAFIASIFATIASADDGAGSLLPSSLFMPFMVLNVILGLGMFASIVYGFARGLIDLIKFYNTRKAEQQQGNSF